MILQTRWREVSHRNNRCEDVQQTLQPEDVKQTPMSALKCPHQLISSVGCEASTSSETKRYSEAWQYICVAGLREPDLDTLRLGADSHVKALHRHAEALLPGDGPNLMCVVEPCVGGRLLRNDILKCLATWFAISLAAWQCLSQIHFVLRAIRRPRPQQSERAE